MPASGLASMRRQAFCVGTCSRHGTRDVYTRMLHRHTRSTASRKIITRGDLRHASIESCSLHCRAAAMRCATGRQTTTMILSLADMNEWRRLSLLSYLLHTADSPLETRYGRRLTSRPSQAPKFSPGTAPTSPS